MNIRTKEGKFSDSAEWVEKRCIKCGNIFVIKESSLKYGRGKYCSRTCCDEHKKEICVGEGNGAFGRHMTDDEKKVRSQISKEMWSDPIIRKKIGKSKKEFYKIHGHWPGASKKSIEKRRLTFLKKYGVDHNWKVKEIRQKCNDTCIKLYGKSMWQLMMEALKFHQTEIEIKTWKILNENHIGYKSQFQLWDDGNVRIYDFFIPSANLLIELDGDFWHGNPEKFPSEKLLEIQKANITNDKYKNNVATKNGYNIVRFWESNINNEGYSCKLLETIKQYENVTPQKKDQS